MKNKAPSSLAPFSCSYTPAVPELLYKLNISLVFSTYQAGKLVLISSTNKEQLSILPRTFNQPMGLDLKDDKMLLATKDEVIILKSSNDLAISYPKKPNYYDALYTPTTTHYTGLIDVHDVGFGNDQIYGVSTSFSCICKFDYNHNFTPIWKPDFISELAPEDRCHLNSMLVENGEPRYVTALGKTNMKQGWRDNIVNGGVLIDVLSNRIVLENIPMPHSLTSYKEDLYLLLSATGELVKFSPKNGKLDVVKKLEGFCRGLKIIEDFAFVGMSKIRKNSSTFAKLPFANYANQAGIKIIHIPTKAFVGEIIFETSIDEIYDLSAIPLVRTPNILNTIDPIFKRSLTIPGNSYWGK